jgi:signal peptidase II
MTFSRRVLLILMVVVVCIGCDQATKSIALSTLPEMKTFAYLGDTFRFQLTYNRGAFLSLGSNLPEVARQAIFIVGICLLLSCTLVVALVSKSGKKTFVLAVSLLFSGGIGNLIDRIIHDGAVVDFMNIGVGSLRTGIFNVADVAIMAGGVLLFLAAAGKGKPDDAESP